MLTTSLLLFYTLSVFAVRRNNKAIARCKVRRVSPCDCLVRFCTFFVHHNSS